MIDTMTLSSFKFTRYWLRKTYLQCSSSILNSRSRLSKLVDFYTSQKRVWLYGFLL